ncbi:MAG: UDP-glucose 4-epimerase, partial [Candidatus Methylomirabilaceae bacterium]
DRAAGRAFNLGAGRETTDRTIFDLVRSAVGATVEPILAEKRPGEIDRICLDSSRIKADLAWEPAIPLEEGIARTVAFYRREWEAGRKGA